ncbi:hypothetical protein NBT05_02045 [Aquimarina sp. ERC-38]|uniref:hypothetical protein n=1 Tax=Aquimarina sp. ERC-38 TaxID=2949996 RepID=UPI002246BF2C|nr:hypothetical protein [Aquimarina sp. ERC-38]UZO81268.1 hypothetical protein NBT05_02045 [Aquimarina sp. ERC-38]
MKISKILSYIVLALGAVGIALWFVMNSSISTLMEENGVSEARELPEDMAYGAVNPLYMLTLVVFVIAIIATLITVFSALAKNPGGLKNTLIGIVAFLVILGIGYVLAEGVETTMKDGEMLSATESKLVGAGLYSFYILAIIAIGMMIVSGVQKLIK